ncbi:hypothetical protein H9P43_004819 [Blastocladiella emersonii ATCC 22665]|nr:hypothetical protein H9P43_004819 [Blastocladiella emersonii ATCC 22665]
MSLLRNVCAAFERFAPLRLAETSWDNVGVLLEAPYPREATNKVFLTIDLTPQVLDEALAHDDLGVIIAYHPTIFRGWKRLNLATGPNPNPEAVKQEMILKLAAKGVSLFCPHTALDSTTGGINDWLASGLTSLGVQSVTPIVPTADSTPAALQGQGRIVTLASPKPLADVVAAIKKHLQLPHVRVATSPTAHLVSTIAMCAGSGISVLSQAKSQPDVYWTGEMSHHDVLAAVQSRTHVVLCEHTNTERGFLAAVLRDRLRKEIPGIEVVVSKVDADPLLVQ